jgi:hypothetical protein
MLAVLAVAYRLIGFVVLLAKTYRRTGNKKETKTKKGMPGNTN